MITFDHVTKHYSVRDKALEDISFTIESGEFVSLIGKSGSGKTTLVKLLLGEFRPTSGNIWFNDFDVDAMKSSELQNYRRNIGFVFQDFKLINHKTVYENIAFAMEVAGKTDTEIIEDIPYVLDLVGLTHKANNFPTECSGGEQQRIAIARAIINQPDLLIADEPTGNLDPLATREVIDILKKINELGTTVIMTTHNKSVVDSLNKRVITLESGRIISDNHNGTYTAV